MKKCAFVLVIFLLTALFLPYSVLAQAENEIEVWDGSIAEGFAGGDGSEDDPFRIENAAQLAFFAYEVNRGELFYNKHVLLTADIYLNDEAFSFDADTGLVKVTKAENVAYYGTEIKGDKSGESKTFDTAPSEKNTWYKWYNEKYLSGGSYPNGELNVWSSIGISKGYDASNSPVLRYFNGHFDGAGHTVYGVFVPFLEGGGNGFFAGISGSAVIENLNLENSLILGSDNAGGILGAINSTSNKIFATVRACSFNGVVVAKECVGGIVGITHTAADIRLCTNKGAVVGEESVGGIVGQGENVRECLNFGDIHGTTNVGGILGQRSSETFGVISAPGVYRCTNHGTVTGTEFVGGVSGRCPYGYLRACHNTGYVKGQKNVGGIVGSSSYSMSSIRAVDCYNAGKVEGQTNVGGIVGLGDASGGYNTAEVFGQNTVGGITGSGNATSCRNDGDIQAVWTVCGGIVGSGSVATSCNYGTVTAKRSVGGVAGSGGEYIRNCYNRGTVTATLGSAGGITAGFWGTIVSCYNVGAVTGTKEYNWDGIGALVGKHSSSDGKIMYCYYLQGCAVTDGEEQPAIGYSTDTELDLSTVLACTDEQMKQASTYEEYSFKSLWVEQEDDYPTLAILKTPHEEKNEPNETYLLHTADCQRAAEYHAFCACGAVSAERFVYGEVAGHLPCDPVKADNISHHSACQICGVVLENEPHDYRDHKVIASETGEYAVVMSCADCGYEMHVPFRYDPPQEPQGDDPTVQKPTQAPQKAEMKPDLRFVLLLGAGVVLGALGSYGVSVVKKARRDAKTKKRDFI